MRTSPARPRRSVLFAAGKGERMRPLTELVAKPALPVLDVPLAAWGLRSLAAFRPTIVNVSHLPESVQNMPAAAEKGVEIFVEVPEPFGTGGTLAALREHLADPILCWNSDMLTDLDASTLLQAHESSDDLATIAVRPTDNQADFIVQGEMATELIDRRTESRAGVQFMGAAVFEKEALHLLVADRPLDLTKGLLKPLLERGRLGVYEHDGYWIDVGTVDRYLRAGLDVLYEKAPPPPVQHPGEILEVEGERAYLGQGARADLSSLGPGAIILAGAQVEEGARVQNSIVWINERVPAGKSIENSVWFAGQSIRSPNP